MAYKLAFGSYTFLPGFKPISQEATYDDAAQQRPRASGAIMQALRKLPLKLSIAGSFMGQGGGTAAIQSAIDTMRAAVEQRQPQKLYFGRDDRYIWAQCISVPESYGGGGAQGISTFGGAHDFILTFEAGWPFFLDNAGTTTANLTSAGGTVTTGGNAATYATWSIPITTGGTGQITLANTTTGETAVISGTFANGDVITLQRGVSIPSASGGVGIVYQVLKNGVAAPSLLLGVIPALAAGANTVTLAATGGIVIGATPTAAYTSQWSS